MVRSHFVAGIAAMLSVALLLMSGSSAAKSVPTASESTFWLEPVLFAEGFWQPTAIEHAGDDRLFVTQRRGVIEVVDAGGQVGATPFLHIQDRVGFTGSWEQGLAALAFHPDYTNNGYFFVLYTDLAGDVRLSRFRVLSGNPNQADPSSEINLLTIVQPGEVHNGGSLEFGPDGYLYASIGDGSLVDPSNRSQDLSLLLGKILRIDVNTAESPPYYTIPPDNPFLGVTGAAGEIWDYGLRNTWRMAFDNVGGDLYIADVGHTRWEEINVEPGGTGGGVNYGWRCYEGYAPFNLAGCADPSSYTFPVHAYSHSQGCAVVGGQVYRGALHPEMQGRYFFADLCSGRIWSLWQDGLAVWQTALHAVNAIPDDLLNTFGADIAGELYVAGFDSGDIFRLQPGDAATFTYLPLMARHNVP